MPDELNDRYERVVLASIWDGLIGPSSHTEEVVVMRCRACASLVACDDEDAHDRWHLRVGDGMRARRR